MIAAVVLAAGKSARLGQPKQLLHQAGQPLVRRVATAALKAGCVPVVVIVGNAREQVAASLESLPVTIVPNDAWEKGIAGSICAGIEACRDNEATVLLACDQPTVDCDVICRLIAARNRTHRPIIASAYAGTLGIPALFSREFYDALRALTGDQGAKSIIFQHRDQVSSVGFASGALDIDLPDDLRHLERENPKPKRDRGGH
jgi:molybdenum cofactor cytidylyltransferase